MKKVYFYIFMLVLLSSCISKGSGYPCYMNKVFSDNKSYTKEYLFSSYGRDTDRVCSFTVNKNILSEVQNFQDLDEIYHKKMERAMNFLTEDVEDGEKNNTYSKKEIQILKQAIKEIKNLETLKGTKYTHFLLEKGLFDDEICIYNNVENKGYCIVIHM